MESAPLYTLHLYPDPEEGGYIVTVPAFPGLTAEGSTRAEAIAAANRAIQHRIDVLLAAAETVPLADAHPRIIEVDVARLLHTWV